MSRKEKVVLLIVGAPAGWWLHQTHPHAMRLVIDVWFFVLLWRTYWKDGE